MRKVRTTDGPSGQEYHHNGDYSGVVTAYVPVREQTRYPDKTHACAGRPQGESSEGSEYVEVEIPFEDMKSIVFGYLGRKIVSFVESAEDDELEQILLRLGPLKPLRGL